MLPLCDKHAKHVMAVSKGRMKRWGIDWVEYRHKYVEATAHERDVMALEAWETVVAHGRDLAAMRAVDPAKARAYEAQLRARHD